MRGRLVKSVEQCHRKWKTEQPPHEVLEKKKKNF